MLNSKITEYNNRAKKQMEPSFNTLQKNATTCRRIIQIELTNLKTKSSRILLFIQEIAFLTKFYGKFQIFLLSLQSNYQ